MPKIDMSISGSPLAIKMLFPDDAKVELQGIAMNRGSFYAGGIASSADQLCVKGYVLLRDRPAAPPIIGQRALLNPRALDWQLFFEDVPVNQAIKLVVEATDSCGHTANVVANLLTVRPTTSAPPAAAAASGRGKLLTNQVIIDTPFPGAPVFNNFWVCGHTVGNPGTLSADATQGSASSAGAAHASHFLCFSEFHFEFNLPEDEFDPDADVHVEVRGSTSGPPKDERDFDLQ